MDLTNQRFGRLLVLEQDLNYVAEHNLKTKQAYWKCKCDCGNIKSIAQQSLRNGATQSCGCYSRELSSKRNTNNLIGKKFNYLTVVSKAPKKNNNRHAIWNCQCECGNTCQVSSDKLINGNIKSCGCLFSNGEQQISKILLKNNIKFIKEKTFKDFNYLDSQRSPRYDFYLIDYNRLIEYDGQQHYMETGWSKDIPLDQRKQRDFLKNQYAKEKQIELVRIPYWELENLNLDLLLGNKYLIE